MLDQKNEVSESDRIILLNKGHQPTLDSVYRSHYTGMYRYAFLFVKDELLAEDIVHTIFLKILEKKVTLDTKTSLKSYLYRSVHNECLNYFKHQKVIDSYHLQNLDNQADIDSSDRFQHEELVLVLSKALETLPEQCRTVFQLSRYEDYKYSDIAQELGISISTVEKHIIKALKRLRTELADFLPVLLWILLN
jgi:RNA polymerase sigma-70 factor (ECF subfamily)